MRADERKGDATQHPLPPHRRISCNRTSVCPPTCSAHYIEQDRPVQRAGKTKTEVKVLIKKHIFAPIRPSLIFASGKSATPIPFSLSQARERHGGTHAADLAGRRGRPDIRPIMAMSNRLVWRNLDRLRGRNPALRRGHATQVGRTASLSSALRTIAGDTKEWRSTCRTAPCWRSAAAASQCRG